MTTITTRLLAATALLALAACSPEIKQELGVGRNSPDEFTVVKRAPLTLPPEYTLRPPMDPSAAPPAEGIASEARAALLGAPAAPAEEVAGDKNLLSKLGADAVPADIRKQIDEENGYIALENRTVAQKLIFWDDSAPDPEKAPAEVVDPAKEAERLKKNKEEGKPANEGDVPVIKKKTNTLQKLF